MGNRSALKVYDFTLTAGGSQTILVESDYFRIMDSTGAVDVTGDTFGTLPGLLAGQGLQNTSYKRLTLRDASGAANTGTILCSGDLFIDNRTLGVVELTGNQGPFGQSQKSVTNVSAWILNPRADRNYFMVQNNDPSGVIYIRLDGAPSTFTTGIKLDPGQSFECTGYCPNGAITAIGTIANNPNVVAVEG